MLKTVQRSQHKLWGYVQGKFPKITDLTILHCTLRVKKLPFFPVKTKKLRIGKKVYFYDFYWK